MITILGRARRRVRAGDRDVGLIALELAIITTFVVVMLLLVVGFGRVSRSRQLVDQAAQAAARAGSLTPSPAAANAAAGRAASETLSGGGMSCQAMSVVLDTSHFYPGGQVVAHIACTANLSGLTMAGMPGRLTLRAQSTSPLENHRLINPGGG